MIKGMRAVSLLICALLLAGVSSAQPKGKPGRTAETNPNEEPDGQDRSWIRAWLDKEQVTRGGEARLYVEVIGSNAADCELSAYPVSDKYEVKGMDGPEFSMRPAVISGGEENELVAFFEMVLVPLETGLLDLPPVRIVVAGGRQFMGPALSLHVTDPEPPEGDFLLSVRLEKNTVYVFERIVFQTVLQMGREKFSAIERAESESLFLSWLETEPSFVSLQMENESTQSTRSIPVMEGRSSIDFSFERKRVDDREVCVFNAFVSYLPTKAGNYSFAPSTYTVRFPDSTVWSCSSEGLDIEVLPLPDSGRPGSATNGVGRFEVRFDAAPRTLRVGDPLELRFSVAGEGNLEVLEMPGFPALRSDFQVQGIDDGEDASRKWRIFHLAPLHDRVREIPELRFSWFDPERREYATRSWGPQEIVLLPRKEGASGAVSPPDPDREAEPPGGEPNPRPGTMSLKTVSLLCLVLLVLSAACYALIALRRRARAGAKEAAENMQAMIAFERGMDSKDPVSPDALARLMGDYLQARFGLSQPEALAGSLSEPLEKQGISIDLARSVERFIRNLDACRFAADGENAAAAEQRNIEARKLVQALEEEAGS